MDKFNWLTKEEPSFWEKMECTLFGVCPKDQGQGPVNYIQDQLESSGITILMTVLVLSLSLAMYWYRDKVRAFCCRKINMLRTDRSSEWKMTEDDLARPSTSFGDQPGDQVLPRQKGPMTMPGRYADWNLRGVRCNLDYEGDIADASDEN